MRQHSINPAAARRRALFYLMFSMICVQNPLLDAALQHLYVRRDFKGCGRPFALIFGQVLSTFSRWAHVHGE